MMTDFARISNISKFDADEYVKSFDSYALLIIDDLGTERNTEFVVSQLFVCLNDRILNQKSTIISTNLTLDEIKANYTERTFSRISNHYRILRLAGDDIRIQKRLMNREVH